MTDLPYLEPLLLWLRNDENLKSEFSDKSFFMPHNDLITATEEAMNKDCPAPRALWILPQDTLAVNRRPGCRQTGSHTFYIEIIVQCIRDQFQLEKDADGKIRLTGQFMKLTELRALVKDSVNAFYKDFELKARVNKPFENMVWVKDQMLYPTQTNSFLATALQYEVRIL